VVIMSVSRNTVLAAPSKHKLLVIGLLNAPIDL